MLSDQKLLEEERNQLLQKKRYFKYYEFKHLMSDYIIKKQNVSNIIEKNNTESDLNELYLHMIQTENLIL